MCYKLPPLIYEYFLSHTIKPSLILSLPIGKIMRLGFLQGYTDNYSVKGISQKSH